MSTKVKGLLKGLRYISQIFENEKEPDIQIGFPTDVKHVAHIGWDGPSATAPTWMTDYKADPSFATLTSGEFEKIAEKDVNSTEDGKPKGKSRRRRSSSGGAVLSVDNPSDAPKHSRRHHSSGGSIIADNPDPSGSSRSSRRHKTQTGPESGIPKQSRRKKSSKGTSGGGGSSRSRSKLADPDNSSESGSVTGNKHGAEEGGGGGGGGGGVSYPISVLEPFEEEKECDEISKKLRDL